MELFGIWAHVVLVYSLNASLKGSFDVLVLCSVILHSMTLNVLTTEITGENCPWSLIIVQIPIYLTGMFHLQGGNLILVAILVFLMYDVYLWMKESRKICKALKMNWIFDVPPKGNNPYQ
jgi:hypothetical protein